MMKKKNRGRSERFDLAHYKHRRGLLSHAYFKVNNPSRSQDLVQDTFLKTWSYLVRGGKIDVMRAFLYHILNQLIIDEYRKKKAVSLEYLMDQGFEPGIDETEKIHNELDGKAAFNLIQRLPPVYRRLIHMRYVQELPLDDIAAKTGHSKNTLAVRSHRGLKKLKKIYTQQ